MVEVGTGTSSSRFLKTDWPITEGIIAGTTRQNTESPELEPDETSVPESEHWGSI